MRVIDLDGSSSCNDLLNQFGILSKGHCPIRRTCSCTNDIVVDLHCLFPGLTYTLLYKYQFYEKTPMHLEFRILQVVLT